MPQAEGRGDEPGRKRLIATVDGLCRGESVGEGRELTDLAAHLLACGLVKPEIRDTVLARLRKRLPLPSLGGFHELRLLEEMSHDARKVSESDAPSVVRFAARSRLADLDRRKAAMRARYVRADGVFPQKMKEVRAERRNGVYLDSSQRGELFEALASTPTVKPLKAIPRNLGDLGAAAASFGQREFGRVNLPPRIKSAMESLPKSGGTEEVRALPEMYTAMLMQVGRLYDRLQLAYHRGGRALDEVRLQFDAEREVVGLAQDLCRLREASNRAGLKPAGGFSESTGLGESIDAIWAEVIDRAGALSDLVSTAAEKADEAWAEADQFERIARQSGAPQDPGADDMTDGLVRGAGDRMLSTEAMRRLRGQLDDDERGEH